MTWKYKPDYYGGFEIIDSWGVVGNKETKIG